LLPKKTNIDGASEIKNEQAHFVLLSACAIFASKNEYRRRFGNKNEQAHFVLLSACAIFAGF